MTSRRAPFLARILLLPLVAFAVALAVHGLFAAAGVSAGSPLRIFTTPLIGALIVYFGLGDYPRAGRLRLAAMVAMGLLLIALIL